MIVQHNKYKNHHSYLGFGFEVTEYDTASVTDTTAPTLSSPTGTATGAYTATGTVSTNEGNGTLYWVVTQSATSPSIAQVKAGQDHLGAAADDSGNQNVSGTGSQGVSASGLTASTTYYFHYEHTDAASNESTVSSSASFTTSAISDIPIHMIGIRRIRLRNRRR